MTTRDDKLRAVVAEMRNACEDEYGAVTQFELKTFADQIDSILAEPAAEGVTGLHYTCTLCGNRIHRHSDHTCFIKDCYP